MKKIIYIPSADESLLKDTVYMIAARSIGKTCASRTFILDSSGSRFEEQPLTLNDLIPPLDKNGKPFEKSKSKFHK